jgi:hypothetical protein
MDWAVIAIWTFVIGVLLGGIGLLGLAAACLLDGMAKKVRVEASGISAHAADGRIEVRFTDIFNSGREFTAVLSNGTATWLAIRLQEESRGRR